jgi:hypothetical protein
LTPRPSPQDLATAAKELATDDGATELLDAACAAAGLRLVTHRRRSVHRREGRSVSHVFEARAEGDDAARDVLLIAHVDSRELPDGAFVLERGATRVAVWRFPHDPFLPGLPSAVDLGRVRELLDGLAAAPGQVSLHTRAYRPSRRAVVEVTVVGREATSRMLYLKVLSPRRAERLADQHRQLSGHVPVPEVLGVAPTQGIVALQALAGRTLREVLTSGGAVPDPGELVELSRRLAGSGLSTTTSPRAFADPSRHVALLCELAPEAAATVRRVAAAAVQVEGPEVVVHGDLHAGQLLIEHGRCTGLLDVDGAGTGLLAHDAGTLVAYLQVLGELHPTVRDEIEAYAAGVADAYRALVGPVALARATAGSWLALATAAHRSQEPDWPATTRARIGRAAAALEA